VESGICPISTDLKARRANVPARMEDRLQGMVAEDCKGKRWSTSPQDTLSERDEKKGTA